MTGNLFDLPRSTYAGALFFLSDFIKIFGGSDNIQEAGS
jgi:hypothetical protein